MFTPAEIDSRRQAWVAKRDAAMRLTRAYFQERRRLDLLRQSARRARQASIVEEMLRQVHDLRSAANIAYLVYVAAEDFRLWRR